MRLLPDHRLVHEHVVEDASERVRRVLALRCVLDGLRDGDAEAPRRVGVSFEDRAAGLRVLRGARDDARAPGLHHRAPVRLLLVRDLDHVDLALEPEELARERDGAAPLAGAGLGRDPRAARLLHVVGLRHGRVRLVAAGRADAFVLVEDPRTRPQLLLEPVRAVERRRPPEAIDVANRIRDRHLGVLRDLLEDQLHREERRQVVRADRLSRPRVQNRLRPVRHVGGDVVPALRDRALGEGDLRRVAHSRARITLTASCPRGWLRAPRCRCFRRRRWPRSSRRRSGRRAPRRRRARPRLRPRRAPARQGVGQRPRSRRG